MIENLITYNELHESVLPQVCPAVKVRSLLRLILLDDACPERIGGQGPDKG